MTIPSDPNRNPAREPNSPKITPYVNQLITPQYGKATSIPGTGPAKKDVGVSSSVSLPRLNND